MLIHVCIYISQSYDTEKHNELLCAKDNQTLQTNTVLH